MPSATVNTGQSFEVDNPVARSLPTGDAPLRKSVSFAVSTLTGHRTSLHAKPTDTIASIKDQIHAKDGIPPAQQRLVLSGEDLADARSVADCAITGDTQLHLMLRLPAEPDTELLAKMAEHGLTKVDQAQLMGEGVTSLNDFLALHDEDFRASRIDIDARRRAKLEQDRAAAARRHEERALQRGSLLVNPIAIQLVQRGITGHIWRRVQMQRRRIRWLRATSTRADGSNPMDRQQPTANV